MDFNAERLSSLLNECFDCMDRVQLEQKICPELLEITRTFLLLSAKDHFTDEKKSSILERILQSALWLTKFSGARCVRKFGIAILKLCFFPPILTPLTDEEVTTEKSYWEEFFILLSGLEEPQHHLIVPLLPKVDFLLDAALRAQKSASNVSTSQFSWHWLRLVMEKALQHRNGWVRHWAIKKVVKLPPVLLGRDFAQEAGQQRMHKPFISKVFLYGCLNDNDPFERFIQSVELEQFIADLALFLDNVADHVPEESREDYFTGLLAQISPDPANCSRWWNICPLYFVSCALRRLKPRPVISPCFYANNSATPGSILIRALMSALKEVQYGPLRTALTVNICCFLNNQIDWDKIKRCPDDISVILPSILSLALRDAEKKSAYAGKLLTIAIQTAELDSMPLLIKFSESADEESTDSTSAANKATPEKFLLDDFVLRCKLPKSEDLVTLADWLDAAAVDEEKQELGLSVPDILYAFTADQWGTAIRRLLQALDDCVGRQSVEGSIMRLLRHFMDRIALCDFSDQFVEYVSVLNHLFSLLKSVARESRKSALFLPTVRLQLRVLLCPFFLKIVLRKEDDGGSAVLLCNIKANIDEHLAQATLNVSLGLVVAEAFYQARSDLSATHWAFLLVQLAAFGPIPKKDVITLHQAYKMVYESSLLDSGLLPTELFERKHEAVQRTRLFALATILSMVSRTDKQKECNSRAVFIQEVCARLEHLDTCKSRSFGLSLAHRQATRLAQLLVLLVGSASSPTTKIEEKGREEEDRRLFHFSIAALLYPGQQHSVKLLVEWLLVLVCTRNGALFAEFRALEQRLLAGRIGSICSWLNVLMHYYGTRLVVGSPSSEAADHPTCVIEELISTARDAFSTVLPWATEQNFSVRCTALASLTVLWRKYSFSVESVVGQLGREQRGAVQVLVENARAEFHAVEAVVRFGEQMKTPGNQQRTVTNLCADFYFGRFDAGRHFCLETILEVFPHRTGMPVDEQLPLPLLREHFQNDIGVGGVPIECSDPDFRDAPSLVYRPAAGDGGGGPAPILCYGHGELEPVHLEDHTKNLLDNSGSTRVMGSTGVGGGVQRKLDVDSMDRPKLLSLLTAKNRGVGKEEDEQEEKEDLVVVGSLIGRPANLGGLCRTCEVFGVRTLCLNNARLVEHVEFQALSLSAEKLVRIEEVRYDDLAPWLVGMRACGYQCVAAEQTTRSVPLEHFHFPARTVLVLGDEKEGVPVELLRHVDYTVEITQLGRTRSLNVHVSAALCIHRFAAQHKMAAAVTPSSCC